MDPQLASAWNLFRTTKAFPRNANTETWLRIAFEAGWEAANQKPETPHTFLG